MSQLNSEIKAKMGLGNAKGNLQSFVNQPLRASASVLQMEKFGVNSDKGSDDGRIDKDGNFPKLNRYNIRTLNQSQKSDFYDGNHALTMATPNRRDNVPPSVSSRSYQKPAKNSAQF